MADATCSVIEDGSRCPRPAIARGWCNKHYVRWQRTGDPLVTRTRTANATPCGVVENGDTCGKPIVAKGLCRKHYSRQYTRGTLELTRRQFVYTNDPVADFWRLVDTSAGDGGCWPWQGTVSVHGYGTWQHSPAHRHAFGLAGGAVPDGHVLDHLCHDPASCAGGPACPHRRCVNPRHLRPVTNAENVSAHRSSNGRPVQDGCSVEGCDRPYVARGLCSRHWQALQRHGLPELPPKSLCSNGHPVMGPDADVHIDSKGHRICRHCRRLAKARRAARDAPNFTACSEPGCGRPVDARGLCSTHYAQSRRKSRFS